MCIMLYTIPIALLDTLLIEESNNRYLTELSHPMQSDFFVDVSPAPPPEKSELEKQLTQNIIYSFIPAFIITIAFVAVVSSTVYIVNFVKTIAVQETEETYKIGILI